jgi:hypothetical protein
LSMTSLINVSVWNQLKIRIMVKSSRCPVIKGGFAGTLHGKFRRMETPTTCDCC